ncbi:MAG: 50S ribosomal protein L19 [Candidatus Omnitrophica bacterium]|nr:50S ribosomal protein L19 [Candidatus Omnitrophota bacterium]
MDKLIMVEKEMLASLKKEYPAFRQGDIVNVHYKIREKDKERIQHLEGIIIKIQGEMHRKSFTLRRIAYGEAYEISFPYYSPNIDKIEVVKKSASPARRKKLYYLRKNLGKQAMLA